MASPTLSDEERFPECFNSTQVDPMTRTRKKPMELLCIGMMRTGTMSMMAAFKDLGYDGVYHMNSVISNPPDAFVWKRAYENKVNGKEPLTREEWDSLLAETQACIDAPCAGMMPQLIAMYPDAKVIIHERDPDKWYQSWLASIGTTIGDKEYDILCRLDKDVLGPYSSMMPPIRESLFGQIRMKSDGEAMKRRYHELHEEVRALVPKEQCLEYKIADGWGPLCKFLGKPVPDKPFPNINQSTDFVERAEVAKKLARIRLAKKVIPWVLTTAAVAVGWLSYKHKFSR